MSALSVVARSESINGMAKRPARKPHSKPRAKR